MILKSTTMTALSQKPSLAWCCLLFPLPDCVLNFLAATTAATQRSHDFTDV